jgi:hypothetical protein
MPPQAPPPRDEAAPALAPERVLAALARASLHRGDARAAVPVWLILAQLHIPSRSRTARRVRALLGELSAAGAVRESRRHSIPVWALTDVGSAVLARAAERGAAGLPESPQHRAWRHARTLAAHEIRRLRAALAHSLDDAAALLAEAAPARSEEWFALAERLRHDARALGSASHCLYEWPEPDDARADVDDGPRGRRNPTLWRRRWD